MSTLASVAAAQEDRRVETVEAVLDAGVDDGVSVAVGIGGEWARPSQGGLAPFDFESTARESSWTFERRHCDGE